MKIWNAMVCAKSFTRSHRQIRMPDDLMNEKFVNKHHQT